VYTNQTFELIDFVKLILDKGEMKVK